MIFVVTFVAFALMLGLMAVGVIFSNRRIQGSCGGLGRVMGEDCEFCEKKDRCPAQKKRFAT